MKTLHLPLLIIIALLPAFSKAQGVFNETASNSTEEYTTAVVADPTPVMAATSAMYAPVPVEQIDINEFKEKIEIAVADSKNNFNEIKGQPYRTGQDTFTTVNCLPGSVDCYLLIGNKQSYFADFGSYRSNMLASEKLDDIKAKLLSTLGEIKWHYSILDKAGYTEEYQVWSKTDSSKYSRIRTSLQKIGNRYKVYLTIEQI